MKIKINGEAQEIPEGLNVTAMLEHLGEWVTSEWRSNAISIFAAHRMERTPVQANDTFEIVHFVGGG